MTVSVFDFFKIGIGPSSSHTMGPMTAAANFAGDLRLTSLLHTVTRIRVDLFGSLALTGKGHGTDRAVMLGLVGYRPNSLCPDAADTTLALIRAYGELRLCGTRAVPFDEHKDIF